MIEKSVSDLIPYVNNSRTHSQEQVKQIASSIKEFGFTNPVLIDDENMIIAGHGRVQAAQLLKIDKVPCVTLSGLTDTQKKAYIIADNKLALNAGWDDEMLANEILALQEQEYDISLLGFDDDEIKDIISGGVFLPASLDEQGQLDKLAPKMTTCPNCKHEYDLRDHE